MALQWRDIWDVQRTAKEHAGWFLSQAWNGIGLGVQTPYRVISSVDVMTSCNIEVRDVGEV